MIRILVITCLAFLFAIPVEAQRDQTLFGQSGLRMTGVWGGPMSNIMTLNDDYTNFSGGFGGLEFNKNVFIGWGGMKSSTDIKLDAFPDQNLEMRYNGLMIGYAPRADRVLHPRFSILAGGGQVEVPGVDRDKIFVIQPSAGIEVNIFRWARIGLDAGYRVVTDTDIKDLKDSDLSGFYGELKFSFGISWRG